MADKSLYLHLYHGFPDAESRIAADSWGIAGPDIGPLIYAHTTYATHIKVGFAPEEFDAKKFFEGQSDVKIYPDLFILEILDECVYLNGIYYGDWSVYVR